MDVSVQNVGEQETTQDVALSVSGLGELGTQSLTLAGGDAGSVSFTVDTTEVDAGDYTHSVSAGDASAEGSLTIMEPASPDDNNDTGNDSSDEGADPDSASWSPRSHCSVLRYSQCADRLSKADRRCTAD